MNEQHEIYQRINHLTAVILIAFCLIAASLIFWSILRAPSLFLREDNPRLVEAELRIQRGTIFDRNGTILAETIGEDNDLQRRYPLPNSGPAVGYYSFRHGTSGVEAGYNPVLRGDSDQFGTEHVRQSLHLPQIGQAIQLSLDADLQETAVSLLKDHTGALILLDNQTGAILAMASQPNYDPNLLDEQFDALLTDENAPLVNRAVQGQYQPGLILQPFLIAWAVENGFIQLDDVVANASEEVIIGNNFATCRTPPPMPATWHDVLVHSCPAPMLALANKLGKAGLDAAFTEFGLMTQPRLPLDTETAVSQTVQDPLMAGIGQDTQIVTPLQIALAWSSLASDGSAPLPWLVTAVQQTDGTWLPITPEADTPITAVSATTAQAIRNNLQDEQFISYTIPVLSGPKSTNSWYMGMSSPENPRYTAVVILENTPNTTEAQTIGQTLLQSITE